MTSAARQRLRTVAGFLATLWLGAVVGIGFATLAKFEAGSLTRPVALDVGRATFEAFGPVELAVAFVLAVAVWLGRPHAAVALAAVGALLVVVLQGAWVGPELSSRADLVLAGRPLPDSPAHALYVSLEGVKVALLLALAVERLGRAEPG